MGSRSIVYNFIVGHAEKGTVSTSDAGYADDEDEDRHPNHIVSRQANAVQEDVSFENGVNKEVILFRSTNIGNVFGHVGLIEDVVVIVCVDVADNEDSKVSGNVDVLAKINRDKSMVVVMAYLQNGPFKRALLTTSNIIN